MTLTEFLTARLDEDEAVARAAAEDDGGETGGFEDAYALLTGRSGSPLDFVPRFGDDAARLITRTAVPARVLREVEAKRAIIVHLVEYMENDYAPWNETALEWMAAVYQDHPDYDEEWRP